MTKFTYYESGEFPQESVTSMNKSVMTFYILTISQVLSLIGSRMTGVALALWLFDETGDSTPVLLAAFFAAIPLALFGSIAGVFVDRWNRRQLLIWSDLGQAVATFVLLLSFLSDGFQIWHLYAVVLVQGALDMLQRPAMEASVALLVPDNHRDRANTLRQITGPLAGIIAPVIAALMYVAVGVVGIIVIDLLTFGIAMVTLWFIHIPQPEKHIETTEKPSVLGDAKVALRFLRKHRVLFNLMIYAAVMNFFLEGSLRLSTPYIITLTDSKELLGVLLGTLNLGVVVGGAVMFVWGGTRPRVHGIMLGLLFRAFWLMVYGIARTPFTLGIAMFFLLSTNALVDASFMSLMQTKIPADLQGRVFALLFQMMYIANPLSFLLTGVIVDNILEPAVGVGGWSVVAPIVGNSAGSGMGLFILINGAIIFGLTAFMYAKPKVRTLEADMPDYV